MAKQHPQISGSQLARNAFLLTLAGIAAWIAAAFYIILN
jgi:hypothetical protein